jgi:hypothetical protein
LRGGCRGSVSGRRATDTLLRWPLDTASCFATAPHLAYFERNGTFSGSRYAPITRSCIERKPCIHADSTVVRRSKHTKAAASSMATTGVSFASVWSNLWLLHVDLWRSHDPTAHHRRSQARRRPQACLASSWCSWAMAAQVHGFLGITPALARLLKGWQTRSRLQITRGEFWRKLFDLTFKQRRHTDA